jgi:hypothetical protein
MVTNSIGVLDPPSAPGSSLSAAALAAHDAALLSSRVGASATWLTEEIGTVDLGGNDGLTLAPAADAVKLKVFAWRDRQRTIDGGS